jgi:hypothetical protein
MEVVLKKNIFILSMCFLIPFLSSGDIYAKGKDNERDAKRYCEKQKSNGDDCKVSAWVGCGPGWTKAKRFNSHRGKDWFACKPMYEYRTITAKLKKSTPLWTQKDKPNGYPSGCGNAAWAILYGYWFQNRGKIKLFEGTDPNDLLLEAQIEMSKYNDTKYGSHKGSKYGRTYPSKMCRTTRYAKKRGYTISCSRDRGREFSKFEKVKKSLDADRPVILLLNNPLKALSTLHYVVIEEAEKKQRKRKNGKWRDRKVRYRVNDGHGHRKWITVREKGINDDKRTGSFSMFHVTIN